MPGRRKDESQKVLAVLSSRTEEIPESDILWLRFVTGIKHPKPWAIKIVSEIQDILPT